MDIKVICKFSLIISMFSILYSCWDIRVENKIQGIAPGNWRGTFNLNDKKIPINFEVKKIKNGEDKIIFTSADFSISPDTSYQYGDTLFINFNDLETSFKLVTEIDKMEGFLYDLNKYNYPVRFYASNTSLERFPNVRKTVKNDISGNWKYKANMSKDSTLENEIKFIVEENDLSVYVRKDSGMTYVMEGTIQGDVFYASGFNGKEVTYLSGKVVGEHLIDKGELIINDQIYYLSASR